jgi:uncharacterized membrane protein YgcG
MLTTSRSSGLISVLLINFCAFHLNISNAAGVVVDGVMDAKDSYSSSFTANWYNGHKREDSMYRDGANTTEVYTASAGNQLFLYMEVPIYAKNMIWGAGFDSAALIDYQDQWLTHHNGTLNMDYGTATGSEKVIFSGYAAALQGGTSAQASAKKDKQGKKSKKDKKGKKSKGSKGKGSKGKGSKGKGSKGKGSKGKGSSAGGSGGDMVNYATSHGWLLANSICDTQDCDADTTTMSFEFEYDLAPLEAAALLAAIKNDGIEYHLSPEMRSSQVPIPASVWLLGSALFSTFAWARRKQKV